MSSLTSPARRFNPKQPQTDLGRDSRSETAHDRDRIIYTSALRRLAQVTQVVRPLEGHVFHNRLTHTLEVAQIARRLAQRLDQSHPELAIDVEAAEAAAFAHDLGHPPFGHLAEKELDRLVISCGNEDGYEGNAQSFRIVTKLAAHREEYPGLNLTNRTLGAILKYPWLRKDIPEGKGNKFGAYVSELDDFTFARPDSTPRRQTIEAQIMDNADGVAYSVHDLDDFYRAGLIPIETFDRLDVCNNEIDQFIQSKKLPEKVIEEHRESIINMVKNALPSGRRYTGSSGDRALLRRYSSLLIDRFLGSMQVEGTTRDDATLVTPEAMEVEMRFLQNLVWRYVITSPRLATQQAGQRRVIRTLYWHYYACMRREGDRELDTIPPVFVEVAREARDDGNGSPLRARVAADIVAGLGEEQAMSIYGRLLGVSSGAVTDLVHI